MLYYKTGHWTTTPALFVLQTTGYFSLCTRTVQSSSDLCWFSTVEMCLLCCPGQLKVLTDHQSAAANLSQGGIGAVAKLIGLRTMLQQSSFVSLITANNTCIYW